SHFTPGWLRTSRSKRASALIPAPSLSRRFPEMPSLTMATSAVDLFAARRTASWLGQLASLFGVEVAPTVIESPNATMVPDFAGASTSTPSIQYQSSRVVGSAIV